GFSEMDLENVRADLGGLAAPQFQPEPEPELGDFADYEDELEPAPHFDPEPSDFADYDDGLESAAEPAGEAGFQAADPDQADAAPDPIHLMDLPALAPDEMELGDWLAAAREMAAAARSSEDRTRNALYEAIGRAYDFSL